MIFDNRLHQMESFFGMQIFDVENIREKSRPTCFLEDCTLFLRYFCSISMVKNSIDIILLTTLQYFDAKLVKLVY